MEITTYKGWSNVPEDFKTKTQLKEIKLKPVAEELPDAYVKAQTKYGWKEFNLYHIKNTQEIKSRVINVREFPITLKNIENALYIINKSAKKSRDTKVLNYSIRKHGIVSVAKKRQMKLYDLKNDVIDKLISENKLSIKGWHKQNLNGYDTPLLLMQIVDITFHMPISFEELKNSLEKPQYLGEIGVISAQPTRKIDMKFSEAVSLLEKYLIQ
ncbi:hypothetical protein AMD01_11315 [Priestia koreensis]|uniref:Uncharacterized protein n=2 Tax=Priestia koreensis TaxID=284581 RepID=A0A0M0L6L6_9BACI|nr:hypothetical protein AMD01_11315 [Priestia koreensis]